MWLLATFIYPCITNIFLKKKQAHFERVENLSAQRDQNWPWKPNFFSFYNFNILLCGEYQYGKYWYSPLYKVCTGIYGVCTGICTGILHCINICKTNIYFE